MPTNTAAWLTASKSLEVKSAPYTRSRENEIVIKNGAVAINPIDWLIPEIGSLSFPWIKRPFILGTDLAGDVVEVGSAVTRFKVGDRVMGFAAGQDKKRNSSAEGAFQIYTVLLSHMASPIPDSLSYEHAAVIPLGLATAACGLFQKDQLALQLPCQSSSIIPLNPTGKTLLVWGGSTSVGSNAIQLAVAAGYDVITTASPRNFDYVKNLGAIQVFDYNSRTVVNDLILAFSGRTIAGALSIGPGAADACRDVLTNCNGDKFLSMATYPVPSPPPQHFTILKTALTYVPWITSNYFKCRAAGIRYAFIFGSTLVFNEVGEAMFADFLPRALAEGKYLASPEPMVVGKGLEFIQKGLDTQRKGVSAKKVVVSL